MQSYCLRSYFWRVPFNVEDVKMEESIFPFQNVLRSERHFLEGFSNLRCKIVGWDFEFLILRISFGLSTFFFYVWP